MAAPVLAARTVCFVNKVGTDDAGYNPVGAPWSHLTIAAALADLAANYPAATADEPHIVAVGPGTYSTPAFALPPNTFICADPDGRTDGEVVISLTGNVTLAAAWSANATQVGGFGNLIFRAGSGTPIVDLTMPAPSAGNPSRILYLENIRENLTVFEWEATGTGDAVNVMDFTQDGLITDAVRFFGGAVSVRDGASVAATTISAPTAIACVARVYNWAQVTAGAGLTCAATSTANCTVRLGACDLRALTLNETSSGVITVSADAVSIPLIANLTFSGTATNADLIRTTDGYAIGGGIFYGLNGQTITGNASGAWAIAANGANQNVTLTPSGSGFVAIAGLSRFSDTLGFNSTGTAGNITWGGTDLVLRAGSAFPNLRIEVNNGVQIALFTALNSVVLGAGAVGTTSVNGFVYIPSCPGTPTGVPTSFTGLVPLCVDSTNNKLYFYSGGAWRDAGP